MIDTCSDPLPGQEGQLAVHPKGKKDHSGSAGDIRVPRRPVPPSPTQLYMVRTMLESILSDRGGGKKTIRKDLDGQHLTLIEHFLRVSYFWPALLNFHGEADNLYCVMLR